MTLVEIQEQLEQKKIELREIQQQLTKLNSEYRDLNKIRAEKLRSGFLEFLEIGFEYKFNGFVNLSGVRTGLKKGEDRSSSQFRNGERVKIIKKNKMSFVIEIVESDRKKTGETYRVDIEGVYTLLLSDENFYKSLLKYIIRNESLNSILN
jgi:hypothetical protein